MKKITNHFLLIKFALFIFVLLWAQLSQALSDEEIRQKQGELQGKLVGEKIAFWAERFVGTPLDKDSQGEYVTGLKILSNTLTDLVQSKGFSPNPNKIIREVRVGSCFKNESKF